MTKYNQKVEIGFLQENKINQEDFVNAQINKSMANLKNGS